MPTDISATVAAALQEVREDIQELRRDINADMDKKILSLKEDLRREVQLGQQPLVDGSKQLGERVLELERWRIASAERSVTTQVAITKDIDEVRIQQTQDASKGREQLNRALIAISKDDLSRALWLLGILLGVILSHQFWR